MSSGWSAFFPRFYRLLARLDPLIGAWWSAFGMGNIVELTVPGRHSGRPRRLFLGLLTVDGRRYLGHPNGDTAWTRNLEAGGGGILELHEQPPFRFRIVRLSPGLERDAVVRASWHQHVFPGNVVYRLARRHVARIGTYYRIEPVDAEVTSAAPSPDL